MKKITLCLIALFSITATPLLAEANKETTFREEKGTTYITSHVKKPLVVTWRTELSDTIQSSEQSAQVPPSAEDFKVEKGVTWFEEKAQDAKNALIYSIAVKVFDAKDNTLMSEHRVKQTLSRKQLFGDTPDDTLHITVGEEYNIHIHIGN